MSTVPQLLDPDAFALALQVHGAMVRKGTTIPCMAHLMAVRSLLLG